MPDGAVDSGLAAFARPDRPAAAAFVTDADSEAALRGGLAEALPEGIEIRRGGIRAAIAAQQKLPTPRVLVVDVSGRDEPLVALAELAEVVEPETCVLAIGESSDLNLYRAITRGLGVSEYLAKPLTRDLVARHFAPIARGTAAVSDVLNGGRFVAVTGARGGSGASVIAASLAWYFGALAHRHTVLLDADLHRGTAALLFDVEPGRGLRAALEAPARIDALLAERAAQPVSDRLHVLCCQEELNADVAVVPGAAGQLLEALRRRYNFIIGDVGWQPLPLARELLAAAQHRVVVMTPLLAAVRDARRMAPAGAGGRQRATLVLNRAGMPGGLRRPQVEDALEAKVDVVIPDLPRQVGGAATLGEPAVAQSRRYRIAIQELARQVSSLRLPAALAAPPRAKRRFKVFG